MQYKLKEIDKLCFTGSNGEQYTGGSQEWYERCWHRNSGCGPVAASNLIWYLTKTDGGMDEYIKLMHDVYPCYTPINRGVCSSSLFTGGIDKYKEAFDLRINYNVLEIPVIKSKRPGIDKTMEFIRAAITADSPMAFLNLTNGRQKAIEHWHWVTIVSYDSESCLADVSDYGQIKHVDIRKWLETSILGGAMVYCTLSE